MTTALIAVLATIAVTAGRGAEPPAPVTQPFNPAPLADEWTGWLVGTWQGTGTSQAGGGKGVLHVERALDGQFLVCRGEASITAMADEQVAYLKRNMHATDEEIARFKQTGYRSLELYTVDPRTGDVLGYLFDNLRCIAVGKGKRDANRETVDWVWRSGHRSTRVTEKRGPDRIVLIERTPMPDGSVMEDRGEMVRVK